MKPAREGAYSAGRTDAGGESEVPTAQGEPTQAVAWEEPMLSVNNVMGRADHDIEEVVED